MRKVMQFILVAILFCFGLLTLFLSTSVIFDLFGIREIEGNYVSFVVWANFFCSLLYIGAAMALLKLKSRATSLLFISTFILAITFVGLLIHIYMDGIYEAKTVYAMLFRTMLTLVFALVAYKLTSTKLINKNAK